MTNDNTPREASPTEDVAWGESIDLQLGVLYRRWVPGPHGLPWEWRPEPKQDEPA